MFALESIVTFYKNANVIYINFYYGKFVFINKTHKKKFWSTEYFLDCKATVRAMSLRIAVINKFNSQVTTWKKYLQYLKVTRIYSLEQRISTNWH